MNSKFSLRFRAVSRSLDIGYYAMDIRIRRMDNAHRMEPSFKIVNGAGGQ